MTQLDVDEAGVRRGALPVEVVAACRCSAGRSAIARQAHDLPVRGSWEGGTITTAVDTTAQNHLDRRPLVQDGVAGLPQLGASGVGLKRAVRDTLIEHERYIDHHDVGVPDISDRRPAGEPRGPA